MCFNYDKLIKDGNVIHTHLSFQQMQLLLVMPILELALEQFTCTLLAALAGRLTSLTAPSFTLIVTVSKATQQMQELDVKVCTVLCIVCIL